MRIALLALFVAVLPAAGQNRAPEQVLRDASMAHQAGDMAAAIRFYREFLKDFPDAAEVRTNLGAALARAGRFDEAIQEYRTALDQMPNNPRVRMNLALAYYKLGRFGDAADALQTLHQAKPAELRPVLLLADCLMQNGQSVKAVELLAPFEREFPNEKAVVYLLGNALLQNNQGQRAQALLDRILRDGESAEASYLLGQSEHLNQSNLPAAKHLARAVELNPNLPGVHALYGTILKDLGKGDLAAGQFALELKNNPYDFTANIETAIRLRVDGEFDKAQDYIDRALQARPGDPGVLFQRAAIHASQGQLDKALPELEQLVRDHPQFAEAYASLAGVYYRLKRKEDGDRARDAARRLQERK